MKKFLFAVLILMLAAATLLVVGCGEESTQTDPADMSESAEGTEATASMGDAGMEGTEALPEAAAGDYTDLTPEQAKQLIDTTPDLVIIDVSPVYADGHLPGAVNYYVGDGSLDAAIPSLDPTAPYLVYCHVDSAAIAGAEALVDAGFSTVYRLQGNYSAWVDAGYPVEK